MSMTIFKTIEDILFAMGWMERHPEDEKLMRAVFRLVKGHWDMTSRHFGFVLGNEEGGMDSLNLHLFDRKEIRKLEKVMDKYDDYWWDSHGLPWEDELLEAIPDCIWRQNIVKQGAHFFSVRNYYLTPMEIVVMDGKGKEGTYKTEHLVALDDLFCYCFWNLRDYAHRAEGMSKMDECGTSYLLESARRFVQYKDKGGVVMSWKLPLIDTMCDDFAYTLSKKGFVLDYPWEERMEKYQLVFRTEEDEYGK